MVHLLILEPKLRSGGIHSNHHINTRLIAGSFNGREHNLYRLHITLNVGSEATLISYIGTVSFFLEHTFEVVKNLNPHAETFRKSVCPHRHNHELLKINAIIGMRPPVQDVHHRDRHHMCIDSAQITVQRLTDGSCGSLSNRQTDPQDGIGTQSALVLCAVALQHERIDVTLIKHAVADELIIEYIFYILAGLQHPFTKIALLIVIA